MATNIQEQLSALAEEVGFVMKLPALRQTWRELIIM